jgi:hypothetical protein
MCESITQTCTISGLPNGVPQIIQVVAHNSVGTSQPSVPSASVTPATTPSTPRIDSARRSNRGAVVVWKPPTDDGGDGVVSYLIQVTQGSNTVSESTTSDTSITLDGLTNGVMYKIFVSATNTVGTGGPSDHAYVTPATVPDPPGAIAALRQNQGTDVSWDAPSNDGGDPITGYQVQVRRGNEPPTRFLTNESPYSIRGLVNGTTYSVTVSAINSVGESIVSESTEVTPATAPDPPFAVTALRRGQGADVSWTVPTNDGGDPITGYRVRIWSESAALAEFETSSESIVISGLSNGTEYRVVVTSVNTVGESVSSESALVTPATVPDAPLDLTALRQDQGADVSWTAPSNDGGDAITGYRIQVQNGDEPPKRFIAAESPYSIQGLENGATYTVRVSAINSVGESVASESALVTPATVPDSPTSLNATAGDRVVELEWSASSNDGGEPITRYRVRIWSKTFVIAEFDTPITSASVPGLTNGVEYRVTVTALNTVGESVEGESATVTPISPAVAEPPVIDPPVVEPPVVEPPVADPPVVEPPVVDPPVIDPPVVEPPIADPPVVQPPIVEPPIVGPPIVDPPVADPPPAVRPPSAPIDVAVIGSTRKSITVGWRVGDSGGAPVVDFIVHTSRYQNRGFTVWPDFSSATPRVELRKPRRGGLYVRVITVTSRGESVPSQATWIARAKKLENTEDGGRSFE